MAQADGKLANTDNGERDLRRETCGEYLMRCGGHSFTTNTLLLMHILCAAMNTNIYTTMPILKHYKPSYGVSHNFLNSNYESDGK